MFFVVKCGSYMPVLNFYSDLQSHYSSENINIVIKLQNRLADQFRQQWWNDLQHRSRLGGVWVRYYRSLVPRPPGPFYALP